MNYYSQGQKSVLETYIERACDPSRFEPDLALNLEICDVIKEKKKNTPREAAVYIVRLVNSRNVHVGMLALALLDNCVKNCGYPFHLQIATKEFLNELVRKFPERPLAVPTPVQNRILEMIEEWYQTICKTSRHKEDLVHIRDMHRLLAYKGYRFPNLKLDSASVLNPVATLKSPAELEEEDKAAHSARLQELIRRGRPEDIRAANELIKKMTGYEQETKPDYADQAATELDKIFQKAVLLTEMLNDVKPGEIIGRGDIFEDLLGTCKAAQPKIQKFISEGDEDQNVEKLLYLNDVINNVIEQYQQVKNGNLVKVAIPGEPGSQEGGARTESSEPAKGSEPSLIDLVDLGEPEDSAAPATNAPSKTGNLMDDLMNLNFNDGPPPAWAAPGSINLGGALFSTSSSSSSVTGAFASSPANSGSPSFGNSSLVQPVSSGSRSSTPGISASVQSQSLNAAEAFGDFDFVSNTGVTPAGPTIVELMSKGGLQVELEIQRGPQDSSLMNITAYFSNSSSSTMTMLTFRVAVPKTLQLQLHPQSSQVVEANSRRSVKQALEIRNPTQQQPVRMRYHISYSVGGQTIEEQGEFNQFPSA